MTKTYAEFFSIKNALKLALCGSVILLPWSIWWDGLFIFLVLLFSLLSLPILKWKDVEFDFKLYICFFAIYFLLHVISLSYTEDLAEGLFSVEKKFTFIILPLCILIATIMGVKRETILEAFLYSVLMAAVVCLVLALKNNYCDNIKYDWVSWWAFNNWFYSYELLALNIGLHPAYFSAYVSVVISYLALKLVNRNSKNRVIDTVLILFFLFFLVLLSSRNVLVTTVGTLMLAALAYSFKIGKLKPFIYSLTIFVVLIGSILLNDITRSRVYEIWDLGSKNTQWGNLSLRIQEWSATWELIKSNFLLGTGPGDFTTEIVKVYQSRDLAELALVRYNSHNQFLQTMASLGIIGFIILVSFFTVSTIKAIKNKDFIFISFIIMFVVFSITESTLEVQKGIVFFVLFNSVLFMTSKKTNLTTS